ncbi:hypothetical protein ES708_29019 [subsurface metagenome]
MNQQGLIEKIKSKGYWRVAIRPTTFNKLHVPTLGEVQKLVQSCIVSLRGWDYPHWNQDTVQNMEDWVESWVDWKYFIEYWRFYQSGQFTHLFALHEDYMNMSDILPQNDPPRPSHTGYLGFDSTVLTLTEIFEFAARLANKGILGPKAFISVGVHNIRDYQLIALDRTRLHFGLFSNYVHASEHPIVIEKEIPEQELVAKPDEFALDYAINIFERFQWSNPPRQVFSEYQKKLRERRL